VIPARAVAKISTRLVADQRPDEAAGQLRAAIAAACPRGVTAELKVQHSAAPSLTNPDNPFIHAAAAAMKQVFDRTRSTSAPAARSESSASSTAISASPAS